MSPAKKCFFKPPVLASLHFPQKNYFQLWQKLKKQFWTVAPQLGQLGSFLPNLLYKSKTMK